MGENTQLACPAGIIKLLKTDSKSAPVDFFANVIKINDHYKAQKRMIVVTQQCLYNIKLSFFRSYSVKRAIGLEHITGLIRNPQTDEFVVKVNASFPNDYRYQGRCWEELTTLLLRLCPNIAVWTLNTNLDIFVRRKTDMQAKRLEGVLRIEQETDKSDSSRRSTSSLSIIHSSLY